MKLILVRHGDIAADVSGKCHGATDIELSETGIRQALALQRRFAEEQIDIIYSSTLKRGIKTAEAIANDHDITIINDPGINEVNFGLIEGLTFEDACGRYPDVADLWRQGSQDLCFPNGESFHELHNRTLKFLERLQNYKANQTVMVVAHGGPLRIMICHLLDISVSHHWQFAMSRASVSELSVYPGGSILERLNDLSHWNNFEG